MNTRRNNVVRLAQVAVCATCWHRADDHATDEDPNELGRCLGNDCACTEYQDAQKTLLDRDDEIIRLTAEIENKRAAAEPEAKAAMRCIPRVNGGPGCAYAYKNGLTLCVDCGGAP